VQIYVGRREDYTIYVDYYESKETAIFCGDFYQGMVSVLVVDIHFAQATVIALVNHVSFAYDGLHLPVHLMTDACDSYPFCAYAPSSPSSFSFLLATLAFSLDYS
jgi:hypothetical protein